MPLGDFQFQTPEAYSSFDFSPLARLGQIKQQNDERQALANLAARYGYGAAADQLQVSPDVPQSPTGEYAPGQISRTFLPLPPGSTASTAISGNPMFRPFSSPTASADVDSAISATAAAAGMDVPHWKAIASIESSLKPNSNFNEGTQYKGLYQIGSRGEGSEWATHGKGNIYDPMDNAVAASRLASDNNARFKAIFNRDPTPIETYMMHQQGLRFYTHGAMTNIAGNTPKGYPIARSPEEFQAIWEKELERRAKFFADHPSKM